MHCFFFLTLILITASSCATKVTRIDTSTVTDLSGVWNDTDARLVAEEMISELLSGSWTNEFNKTAGRSPVVIVGTIKNKTYEHISTSVFTDDLERALTNSGKVQFVADPEFRQEIRAEREEQLGNAEPSTVSLKGHETGADFMLQGTIDAIQDAVRGKYAMFYQVTLELIDMKNNQKKWIGQKEIKKIVQRPSVRL